MAETKNHRAWANLVGWRRTGKSHADSCWSRENPRFTTWQTLDSRNQASCWISSHFKQSLVWRWYFTDNRCFDTGRWGFQPKSEVRDALAVLVSPLHHLAGQGGVVFQGVEKTRTVRAESQLPPRRPIKWFQLPPIHSNPLACSSIPLNSLVFYSYQCFVWHCIAIQFTAIIWAIQWNSMHYKAFCCTREFWSWHFFCPEPLSCIAFPLSLHVQYWSHFGFEDNQLQCLIGSYELHWCTLWRVLK